MYRRFTALFILAVLASPAAAEPFLPAADSVVLERLPTSSFADPELRRLRAEHSKDPKNAALAAELARRYIETARATGDPRWNGYAQAALDPWWREDVPPSDVLLLRATLYQNRHDFDAALEDLTRLLRRNPRHPQAWWTRAVVLQVRGEFRSALESCQAFERVMRRRARRSLSATACLATVMSHMGHAERGYELLHRALLEAPRNEDQVWPLTNLAQIAERRGENELAEGHYREALAFGVRDIYLLAAYADFLLDRERPREVVLLLEEERLADALYLRFTLAAQKLGAADHEEHVRVLADRFAAARLRGEETHLGSEARFVLHALGRPGEALELALRNWAHQKEPIDARWVLEAALAAGQPEQARPVAAWLADSGLEDVRLEPLTRRAAAAWEAGP